MAYIPLIKKTNWIDLSNEHKRLRDTVERDLREGCCEKGNIQPIMLQGAFGIGKTTTLYYIFHYCWEVLKTPAFYMPLAKIVEEVKNEVLSNESSKVENHRLSLIIKKMIDEQIELLKSDNYDEVYDVAFPEFQSGDENVKLSLNDYLQDFISVGVKFDEKEDNPFKNIVFNLPFTYILFQFRSSFVVLIQSFFIIFKIFNSLFHSCNKGKLINRIKL
mgnify:CR=1 FL=1